MSALIGLSDLAALSRDHGFDPDQVASLARWGYRLLGSETSPPLGATKLGGDPDLPEDLEWPTFDWREDGLLPMMFLGQVRLNRLSETVWPSAQSGMLSFFYAGHPRLGPSDHWDAARVLFVPADAALTRRRARNPAGRQPTFNELSVAPRPVLTLPDDDLRITEQLGLGDSWHYRDRPPDERRQRARRGKSYHSLREALERAQFPTHPTEAWTPLHQFLGWPWSANGSALEGFAAWRAESERDDVDDDALSKEALRWRLLLAVGHDYRLGYEIGDGGSVLIGVPNQDLLAGSYDSVQGITESG